MRELREIHRELRERGLEQKEFDIRVVTHEALRLYIQAKRREIMQDRILKLAEEGKLPPDAAGRLMD